MDTDSDNAKLIDTLLRLGAGGWYVCDFDGFAENRPHGLHWCTVEFQGGHLYELPRCSAPRPVQSTKYIAGLHDDQPKCYECAVLYLVGKENVSDAVRYLAGKEGINDG